MKKRVQTKLLKKNPTKIDSASFRDPSGFVFFEGDQPFRTINAGYHKHYHELMNSGLYHDLVKKNLLIQHSQIKAKSNSQTIVIKPEIIPFISYPYEWSFSQFKDAALLTLQIQKIALTYGMTLKDASAYNIQFLNGRPVLIDTLSFEIYEDGSPWVAYKQFCQHFLAPLVLMSKVDLRLSNLMKIYIDGIPLDLVSKLLPKSTWIDLPVLTNIHLHSAAQQKFASSTGGVSSLSKAKKMPKIALMGLIDQLFNSISKLKLKKQTTEWGEYYTFTNYQKRAFETKRQMVKKYLQFSKAKTVWDMGANDGEFSRVASSMLKLDTVAFDIDPIAVEKNYLQLKSKKESKILPLIMDLTNPSSGLGWNIEERKSLINRGPVDMIMALALIQHLAISNNTPLNKVAEFFSRLGEYLIIEFVPKSDSKVKILLSTREDIFDNYNEQGFEDSFSTYYNILNKEKIAGSERYLYLMRKL